MEFQEVDTIHEKNDSYSFYNKKEYQVRKDFELILEAYNFKEYDKGRRDIHMGILMNHTQISRLMKKYNLFCPIRKTNPVKRMVKAIKISNFTDDILNELILYLEKDQLN